jgi:hypothetical protein
MQQDVFLQPLPESKTLKRKQGQKRSTFSQFGNILSFFSFSVQVMEVLTMIPDPAIDIRFPKVRTNKSRRDKQRFRQISDSKMAGSER